MKNQQLRQQQLSPEKRIADLESDQLRLIDMVLDLDRELDRQNKFIRKILHLVKEMQASSSFSEALDLEETPEK